jgi:putative protease
MAKKTIKKRKIAKKAIKKTAKKSAHKAARRTFKKKAARSAKKPVKAIKKPVTKQTLVGVITHFYPNISVGVVDVKKDFKIGDTIIITGHGRSFEQKVYSMQLEHEQIKAARKNQLIGMKVAKDVKEKDLVYLK